MGVRTVTGYPPGLSAYGKQRKRPPGNGQSPERNRPFLKNSPRFEPERARTVPLQSESIFSLKNTKPSGPRNKAKPAETGEGVKKMKTKLTTQLVTLGLLGTLMLAPLNSYASGPFDWHRDDHRSSQKDTWKGAAIGSAIVGAL